jgi:hypothetical protein
MKRQNSSISSVGSSVHDRTSLSSRRSASIRSPGFRGVFDGATTEMMIKAAASFTLFNNTLSEKVTDSSPHLASLAALEAYLQRMPSLDQRFLGLVEKQIPGAHLTEYFRECL